MSQKITERLYMRKILYFDVETTGTNAVLNDIVQLSGIIEIDGKVVDTFNLRAKPTHFDTIQREDLEVTGLTEEELKQYPDARETYQQFVAILSRHCNKFNKSDKFYPAGFNVGFDLDFLNQFFRKQGDVYFDSWVNWKAIDPLPFLRLLDLDGKLALENYKLSTVCSHLGIEIQAHDALSDITATREVILHIRDLVKDLQITPIKEAL